MITKIKPNTITILRRSNTPVVIRLSSDPTSREAADRVAQINNIDLSKQPLRDALNFMRHGRGLDLVVSER